MTILHIDFETRGTADLRVTGLDVYARHPGTDVWCMAWAIDDGPVQLWAPQMWPDTPLPDEIRRHAVQGGLVYAHNAAFELAIWNYIMATRYGWPPLPVEQARCTMALCYAMSLPAALENAAAAVGLAERKDAEGRRVMMMLAKPKAFDVLGNPIWHSDPEKLEKLYEYCRQDVRVERQLHSRILELTPEEQTIWQLDQEINNRGVFVDRPAVDAAAEIVAMEQIRLNKRMQALTGGVVGTCNATGQLKDWAVYQGVPMAGVAKADIIEALLDDEIPASVREALELRQEAAKSSTAKLKPMIEAASEDGRLRGMFQYHGAGPGRWTGRRVQLQNLPRYRKGVGFADVDKMIEMIRAGQRDELDFFYGPVMFAVSDSLRGFLRAAPGKHLIAVDFSNIQGRITAWAAGEEWKVQAFRDYDAGKGHDIYILTYAKSFGLDPRGIGKKDPRRQVGKVEELAFMFGGGLGAWRTMEKGYAVPKMVDDAVQDIKQGWRFAHPKIADYDTGYWAQLDNAAIAATLFPGCVFAAGAAGREVKFKVQGSFLWLQLPSKRCICYPYPEVRNIETPWGVMKEALTYKTELTGEAIKKAKIVEDPGNGGKWWRVSTYGGSLTENIAMAIERDCLAAAMLRLTQRGYDIVMHSHDEVVVEVPEDAAPETQKLVEAIVAEPEPWMADLPVAVEGWRHVRYRK